MKMATSTTSSGIGTRKRLEKLQNIDQEIGKMLTLAADTIHELSRTTPSSEVVEYKTKDFLKTIEAIESGLSEEITYLTQVSTVHPHEGSIYGAEKDYELTCWQTSLAKERLQRLPSRPTETTAESADLSNGVESSRTLVSTMATNLTQ